MKELKIQRAAFISELREFISDREDMSIAEILYSFLRTPKKFEGTKLSDILSLSDDKILDKIETAKELENE